MPAAVPERIPLTVIGGYLGAGKTTVLNEVLRSTDTRVAVLVNDFGEIDVDASLVASHSGETISLTNGCVCCSLADGFFAALQTVRAVDPPVDHVLVEASGVADAGQVAQWGHTPGFRLDGVVVVADADAVVALAADAYVGDTVRAQLRAADLVLVTKLDLVDDVAPVRAWIATVTDAPVVDAPHGRVPLSVLVGTATTVDPPLEPARHPAYVTASVESDAVVDPATLASALTDRPVGLLRAKGIVRVADAPDRQSVVQVVGRRHDVRPGDPWPPDARSRMVGIARPPTTRDELAGWLHHLVGRSAP